MVPLCALRLLPILGLVALVGMSHDMFGGCEGVAWDGAFGWGELWVMLTAHRAMAAMARRGRSSMMAKLAVMPAMRSVKALRMMPVASTHR